MTSFIKSFLGYTKPAEPEAYTQKGLPASWYRSKPMYELERRAIFSQKWIMVTHKHRFTKPGDYVQFTEAGFSFFLCLDRQGNLNGFHNVCRHRGFPLVHDDSNNVKILACKYHGWSYGIDGKLAKAPHFENMPDFLKEQNGLLPIHVHIDGLGFVWVNLDVATEPAVSWNDDLIGADTQKRFENFDFSQYQFDHTWDMKGNYNWKTLADNYNECLHCKVAHPCVAGLADITVYKVDGHNSYMPHYTNVEGSKDGKEVRIASTYYFPNSCMTVSPHFFYLMRCVPTSETTCSMENEVYRHRDATDGEFQHIDALFKQILAEDKWLCNATQQGLNQGVYVNGQMHTKYEQGSLYFQGLLKKAVMDHRAQEDRLKKEIWPATQRVDPSSETSAEMQFCAALDPGKGKSLDW